MTQALSKTVKPLEVLVPIVSPCTSQGAVDLNGLKAVGQEMLAAGCKSIFVCGSTGRGPWFSRRDRAAMCEALAGAIGSDVPLLAGCMAPGLPHMLENAHTFADAGAQVAVVTAPGYFAYSQSEIETIFLRFADASPLPVVIYDIPAFTDVELNSEMVARLAHHENIVGFKDSSADFGRFDALSAQLRELRGFNLLQGKERLLADSLGIGASGFVVSLIHIDPYPFVALYRAVRSGQMETARRLQAEINKVIGLVEECLARRPETSTLFHFLNWTLTHRQLCANILLEHEGECPQWLADKARSAVEICAAARMIQE